MKECSPLNIARLCREVKTPVQVFNSGLPSIALIKKQYGPDFTEAYIAIWITNMVDYVNVGKKMGEQQILETAMLILDEYWMLTLADINLVFQRAKKGHYGELYDRLDGIVILSWFKKYFDERCETAENVSMREHEKLKTDGSERSYGKAKELISEAANQYKKDQLLSLKK